MQVKNAWLPWFFYLPALILPRYAGSLVTGEPGNTYIATVDPIRRNYTYRVVTHYYPMNRVRNF